jgi:hypothetical protein
MLVPLHFNYLEMTITTAITSHFAQNHTLLSPISPPNDIFEKPKKSNLGQKILPLLKKIPKSEFYLKVCALPREA